MTCWSPARRLGPAQGREPLGPLGFQPDPGLLAIGGRGGQVGVSFGRVLVAVGIEAQCGGGGPAQDPVGGSFLGSGDLGGIVILHQLFGGEQAQEVVEAVAVGGGVGLEQSGVGQPFQAAHGLAWGYACQEGCGGGAEVRAVGE